MHVYPRDLAILVMGQWHAMPLGTTQSASNSQAERLPDLSTLEHIFSACYQTGMMEEENRPLRFRLILKDPDLLPPDEGPPTGMHRLMFKRSRPFNEHELRRLVPAADFDRSLIGISCGSEEGPSIWGLIHSGARWVQALRGGSKEIAPLPDALTIYVTRPGRLTVCRGPRVIAIMSGGRIIQPSANVFQSLWIRESFRDGRFELMAEHAKAKAGAGATWAMVNEELLDMLYLQVVKRIISISRSSGHGGTFIILPSGRISDYCFDNPCVSLKYWFRDEDATHRLRTLFVKIMNTLAKVCGDVSDPDRVVGWTEYVAIKDDALAELDEAVFEYAHFVANLSTIDGAVVTTTRHELIGFGAFILGSLDNVPAVARALDAEGDRTVLESIDGVGTRHRAAYHLCNTVHDALVLVISQDGDVQFVRRKDGAVTFWNVVPLTFLGLEPVEGSTEQG